MFATNRASCVSEQKYSCATIEWVIERKYSRTQYAYTPNFSIPLLKPTNEMGSTLFIAGTHISKVPRPK